MQTDDYIEYWAAGRLNILGQNPYSMDAMEVMQGSLGRQNTLMMWNPPFVLPLAMLLALLPYPLSRALWLLIGFAATALAVAWLWNSYTGNRRRIWIAWLAAFLFTPTLVALRFGQISPLMLLGIAGFLWYENHDRPWTAGVFASLTLLKPHWVYLLWLALLLWSIERGRWKMILGSVAAILAATLVGVAFNPSILLQYISATASEPPLYWATPTLGSALASLSGYTQQWLHFVPMLLGCVWVLLQWFRNRAAWNWRERLPQLVLVSALASPYGWTFDQVTILAALVPALGLLHNTPRRSLSTALLSSAAIFNLMTLFLRAVLLEHCFWWVAPAWLLWYALVIRFVPRTTNASSGHMHDQTINPMNTLGRS